MSTASVKLTRTDVAVAGMRTALQLSETATIEEVQAKTEFNAKDFLNLYIQEEEPELKDGIWLQTAPFEYDGFTVDEDVHFVGGIEAEDRWPKLGMPYSYSDLSFYHQGYAYIIFNNGLYRYDANTMIGGYYATFPKYPTGVCPYRGYVYFTVSDSLELYRMNLETLESNKVGDMPYVSGSQGSFMAVINDELFIFIGNSNQVCKYNFNTEVFSKVKGHGRYLGANNSIPISTLPVWNGRIIVPNIKSGVGYSDEALYLFDPETEQWTYLFKQLMWGLTVIGNDLYYAKGSSVKYLNKYNLASGTNITITLPVSLSKYAQVLNVKEKLFYLYVPTQTPYSFATDVSSYEDNTIVLVQGAYQSTSYRTALFSIPETKNGKLLWSFANIYPYINGEFLTDIPSYYGSGTEWIKFKN